MTYKEKYDSSDSWQDKVATMNLFHRIMVVKHKTWTMKNTAKYFDVSLATVSENTKLGLHFEEVKQLESRKRALFFLATNNHD